MLMRRIASGVVVCALSLGTIRAQESTFAASGRKFEVVSIRENPSRQNIGPGGPTPDGYSTKGIPMIFLVLMAYAPQSSGFVRYGLENIVGLPQSANKAYDIDARVSDDDRADWQDPKKQPAMLRAMLQSMLEERFHMVVHREMKEMPVYNLVLAKSGPKFQHATGEHPADASPLSEDGGYLSHKGAGAWRYYDVPMKSITMMLSGVWSGRPVLDRTGLTGRYDITMNRFLVAGVAPATDSGTVADSPTVFSAVGELGLKLEPAKGQVEMLVIDHIEPPTEN